MERCSGVEKRSEKCVPLSQGISARAHPAEMRERGFPGARQPVVLAWHSYCIVRVRKNYLKLCKMPGRIGKYWCFPVREGVTWATYELPGLKSCQAVVDL